MQAYNLRTTLLECQASQCAGAVTVHRLYHTQLDVQACTWCYTANGAIVYSSVLRVVQAIC